ncbi:MAG: peptide ABC transporter substrate-binding protein [Gemmatimonadaceae bacterium]
MTLTPFDRGPARAVDARASLRKASWRPWAFALACAAVACHPSGADPRGRELVVNLTADADLLLPPFASTTQGAIVADQIFERLADPDSTVNTIGDRDYRPRLADRWTWAPDSLSIAFHLDPRARWQDGAPVTARDVQFSFRVFKDSAAGSIAAPLLSNIDSASVRDSTTAVVWFHARTPDEFYTATYSPRVLPAHLLDTIPPERWRTSVFGRAPVGSGPYRFVRWSPGSFIQLGADSAYRGGRPAFDELLFTITRDPSVAITRLLSREVDFVDRVGASDIPRVRARPEIQLVRWPSEENVALLFNLREANDQRARSPLDDRRVRAAIALAIDRGALVRGVLGETARVAVGPVPSVLLDSVFLPDVAADSSGAARLLDAAGWDRDPETGVRRKAGRPLSVSLLVPTSSAERMSVAVVLQAQLRRLGIDVAIDETELNTSLQAMESGEFDATLLDLTWDPSPASARQIWASASAPPGGSNFGRYANPDFDAILDSALKSESADRAHVLYRRAWSVLVRDAPAVWLYDLVNVGAVRRPIEPRKLSANGWWSGLAWWARGADNARGR